MSTTSGTSALAGKTVVAVSAGAVYSLALCSDGTVAAWGCNDLGQLGNASTNSSLVPVAVSTDSNSALFGKTVVAVAAGYGHSLALCSDGMLAAWGNNAYGQLGNGSKADSLVPVAVSTFGNTSALYGTAIYLVRTGGSAWHSLVLASPSTIPRETVPVAGVYAQAASLTFTLTWNGPVSVIAGSGGTLPRLVLDVGGAVRYADYASGSGAATLTFTYKVVDGDNDVDGITLTGSAVDENGASIAYIAGDTIDLRLPLMDTSNVLVDTAPAAPAVTSITRLLPGPVTTADRVAWRVTFSKSVTGVDVTDFALTQVDGSATGTISGVEAGNSAAEYIVTATNLAGIGTLRLQLNESGTDVVDSSGNAIAGGFTFGQPYTHTRGSVVVAWGDDDLHQLGHGQTTQDSAVPVSVSGTGALSGKVVSAVSAGSSYSLALCSDGTVAAWGYNWYGQLGNAATDQSAVPVAVSTDSNSALFGKTVVAVSAGYGHSLALCSDGTVAAWGYNYYGQLGNATTMDSAVPVAVSTESGSALFGKTVVGVAAGYGHSLALCSDGTVAAWGMNTDGQLGINSTADRDRPVAVSIGSSSALFGKTVVAVAAGYGHSVALCRDGAVVAWGANGSGQLGNNSTTNSRVPVVVNTTSGTSALYGETVVAVSVGQSFTLALCGDGSVASWGCNELGELGDATTANSAVPVAVATDSRSALFGKVAVAVSAGLDHSVVLSSDGTMAAWGYNAVGQLGDATMTDSLLPVAVDMNSADGSALAGKSVYLVGTGGYARHSISIASPASISAVATPAAGSYNTLLFTLTTTEAAMVDTTSGMPQLVLTVGSATRYATYASGSGTTSLVFTYTATAGDSDIDGIAVTSTAIDLNGGTITDSAGWAIDGTLPAFMLPTIVVDTTPPQTSLAAAPAILTDSDSATFVFSGDDATGSGVASFEASLDGGAYAAVTSPVSLTGLADGGHTFAVRAVDNAGNKDATPATCTWRIDTTAPETSLSATPAVLSTSANATFGFTGDDASGSGVASFEASLDGVGYATATSPVLLTGLYDGAHTFTVRTVDNAGNKDATPATFTWTVDTTPPAAAVITSERSSAAAKPTLAGAAEAGCSVAVSEYGELLVTTVAGPDGRWSLTSAKSLPPGTHDLVVTVTDAAGNRSTVPATIVVTAGFSVPTPDGYAAGVTGGSAGNLVIASTTAEFAGYAGSSEPLIITVAGTLNVGTVAIAANKTIQGADRRAALEGCLRVNSASNVVIRGLTLGNVDGDALQLIGASRVFITHCTFRDSAGRQIATSNSDNVTMSWCSFGAFIAGQAGVRIGTETDTQRGHVTLHHNGWFTNLGSALPQVLSGYVHQYSDAVLHPGNTTGTVIGGSAQLLSERNLYHTVNAPLTQEGSGVLRVLENTYTGCTGTAPAAGTGNVFVPDYSYSLLAASDLADSAGALAGNTDGAAYVDESVGTARITTTATTVNPGAGFTLTATPTGVTAASYQWRLNNTPLAGATAATYSVASMASSHAGTYTVALTSASGDTVISTPVTIVLGTDPNPGNNGGGTGGNGGGSTGGGGGGGGSPSLTFFALLAVAAGLRACRRR